MPNWCSNTLTLGHNDPKMLVRAREAFAEGRLLAEFIPCPPELNITSSPGTKDEALQAQYQANKEKYGYETWYDWCFNEWGTKWDVGDGQGINCWDDKELVVYFDSAWSPPIAAYQSLENQGFRVTASYYEPGCGFCGEYDEHGDQCYDLGGMNSGDVQSEIPSWLDEQYGISESMAEFEEEDDVTTWYKEGVEATGLEPHKKVAP